MTAKKNQFTHELSNLLSYTRIAVESSIIHNAEKKKINKWISLAGLLIQFEGVFMGRTMKIPKYTVELNEILDLVIAINQSSKKGAKISFENPDNSMLIKSDRTTLEESLNLFIKYLTDVYTHIRFKTNPKKSTVEIKCEGNANIKIIKTSPFESLKRENLNNMEIPLQLALELFSMQNIDVKISKGAIQLTFPK